MARRRGNGEGCISKEKSGRYRIMLTWMHAGKQQRRQRTCWKYADAQAILEEMKADRLVGCIAPTNIKDVAEYFEWWLKDGILDLQETTRESYGDAVKNHIKPGLGAIPFRRIQPAKIVTWVAEMERNKIGSRTRQNAFKVASAAFETAVMLGMLPVNPCQRVATPKHVPKEMRPFTLSEAASLMKKTEGTRWHALTVLALTTGLRIGELLGLEWSKINWKDRSIRIDQQAIEIKGRVVLKAPKTASSIRYVEMTPKTVAALKAHQVLLAKESKARDPATIAIGEPVKDFVFPAPGGGVSNRGNVRNRFWNPLLLSLGLPHRGIHNTRHTYATHALLAGVAVLVVSKVLGHSKPSVTLDIYGHVLQDAESRATETITKLFG